MHETVRFSNWFLWNFYSIFSPALLYLIFFLASLHNRILYYDILSPDLITFICIISSGRYYIFQYIKFSDVNDIKVSVVYSYTPGLICQTIILIVIYGLLIFALLVLEFGSRTGGFLTRVVYLAIP